ncbi:cupin domain-containing protein [Laceyella sacchari]|jgi:mannose-6-phosphate isomerase-like protein (cupin superfamily)|uniref:Cupin domain-containing protein n=1 Tax=Laceyella sacchari TaxID=37482 RepID=A0ABY5U4K1_LACSH|nr:cupin domain-containing protein [Laceyella sacchari]UWE04069.1 cupin domain-containing protein [Laceyella sacchari]
MSRLVYPHYMNPYFYYGNFPQPNRQVCDAILAGIKREATEIDLLERLVKLAPNQKHKREIFHTLEDEKAYLHQLTDLYVMFTGRQPVYQIDQITFDTYEEGIQKAFQVATKDYKENWNSYLLTQHSPVGEVFLSACHNEMHHANRLSSLSFNPFGIELKDYGKTPFVVNIEKATKQNNTYRTALWTGDHLQVTLMCIGVGDDIGLEVHPNVDQFLRIEQGRGLVQMGDSKDRLDFRAEVYDDYAIMVPAGKWHNLTNTGNKPLKLYSIYAPPEHPFGTVHRTKADAMEAER